MDEEVFVEQALRFLRGHTIGDLRFGEHLRPLRYIALPDGRLATPVMVAMLEEPDTVLFIPECVEGAMEVMVALSQFDENTSEGGSAADRWRIYHGEPEDVRWAFMDVMMARYEERVIDGDALMVKNLIAEDVPTICKTMNQQRSADLAPLCEHFAHRRLDDPVAVGADQFGLDVRGRFEVARVPARQSWSSGEEALSDLEVMAAEAREAIASQEQGG